MSSYSLIPAPGVKAQGAPPPDTIENGEADPSHPSRMTPGLHHTPLYECSIRMILDSKCKESWVTNTKV